MKNFSFVLFILILFSCQQENKRSTLEQLVKEESKQKEQQNDLLLGIDLKMPQGQFFDYCMKKNQSGEFSDGGRYQQVKTRISDGFTRPVDFYFFNEFNNGQLIKQENKFIYKGWAAWDDATHTEYLLPEVMAYLQKHFGDDFIEIEDGKQKHYVDIDANRRIDVYTKPLDDAYVYMDVIDLRP